MQTNLWELTEPKCSLLPLHPTPHRRRTHLWRPWQALWGWQPRKVPKTRCFYALLSLPLMHGNAHAVPDRHWTPCALYIDNRMMKNIFVKISHVHILGQQELSLRSKKPIVVLSFLLSSLFNSLPLSLSQSIYLPMYLSMHLYICLTIYLVLYFYVYLSVYLSIFLPIHLSIPARSLLLFSSLLFYFLFSSSLYPSLCSILWLFTFKQRVVISLVLTRWCRSRSIMMVQRTGPFGFISY